jgi:hypothetical protein
LLEVLRDPVWSGIGAVASLLGVLLYAYIERDKLWGTSQDFAGILVGVTVLIYGLSFALAFYLMWHVVLTIKESPPVGLWEGLSVGLGFGGILPWHVPLHFPLLPGDVYWKALRAGLDRSESRVLFHKALGVIALASLGFPLVTFIALNIITGPFRYPSALVLEIAVFVPAVYMAVGLNSYGNRIIRRKEQIG